MKKQQKRNEDKTIGELIEDPKELVLAFLATASTTEKRLLVDFIFTRHYQRRLKKEGNTKGFLIDEDGDFCNEHGNKIQIAFDME